MLDKSKRLCYNKLKRFKVDEIILTLEFIVSVRGVELRFAAFSFYDIIKRQ